MSTFEWVVFWAVYYIGVFHAVRYVLIGARLSVIYLAWLHCKKRMSNAGIRPLSFSEYRTVIERLESGKAVESGTFE